jgi:tetratricopeptide (TPR) repeat protein
MVTPRPTQLSNEAETKAREGDYARAINLYEAALDGSPNSAEVHYQLALIYDDKMNDPLNALHHFKRFLALDPTSKRAQEVKGVYEARRVDVANKPDGGCDGASFRTGATEQREPQFAQANRRRLGEKEGGERRREISRSSGQGSSA